MSTKYLIGKFVQSLEEGQIFVTRELMTFGLRSAVDSATHNLVARGKILRLANGVFVRNDPGLRVPDLGEIVEAKARAHGKKINSTPAVLAFAHGLKPKPRRQPKNKKQPKFGIDLEIIVAEYAALGHTSSFKTIYGRVQFRKTPERKFFLSERPDSREMVAWWGAEKTDKLIQLVKAAMSKLSAAKKRKFREIVAWTPAWISDLLIDESVRFEIQAPKSIYPLSSNLKFGESPPPFQVNEEECVYKIAS